MQMFKTPAAADKDSLSGYWTDLLAVELKKYEATVASLPSTGEDLGEDLYEEGEREEEEEEDRLAAQASLEGNEEKEEKHNNDMFSGWGDLVEEKTMHICYCDMYRTPEELEKEKNRIKKLCDVCQDYMCYVCQDHHDCVELKTCRECGIPTCGDGENGNVCSDCGDATCNECKEWHNDKTDHDLICCIKMVSLVITPRKGASASLVAIDDKQLIKFLARYLLKNKVSCPKKVALNIVHKRNETPDLDCIDTILFTTTVVPQKDKRYIGKEEEEVDVWEGEEKEEKEEEDVEEEEEDVEENAEAINTCPYASFMYGEFISCSLCKGDVCRVCKYDHSDCHDCHCPCDCSRFGSCSNRKCDCCVCCSFCTKK